MFRQSVRAALCSGSLIGVVLACHLPVHAQMTPSFVVSGRITTSVPAKSVRIVLEDPKKKGVAIAETTVDEDGSYELRNLALREYRMVAWLDGKKQDSRKLEILCRPGTVMKKSFFYGKNEPAFTFYFPLEDPEVADVQEILASVPSSVMKEYGKARTDYINGNTRSALFRLEALLPLAPEFYGLHTRLGMLYEQSGCYEDAESEYQRAGELSPRSSQPLLNLARVQIQGSEGMPDETDQLGLALENLKRAIALKPTSAVAHCLAGAAYERSDSAVEAELSFKRALELDSNMPAARLMLGYLYMRQEDWSSSLKQFDTYLEDHPFAADRPLVKSLISEVTYKLVSADQL
jgi:tetratricopeptide (TPR) repeat protein